MRTIAPAKINWTLEVLGRRADGYHEIRSVMQTIDLCDEVFVQEGGRGKEEEGWVRAGSAWLTVDGDHVATEDDLALRVVGALEKAIGRELPVEISLVKRIPVASGLGGGSSDSAAVLRLLNTLYSLGLSNEYLAEIGGTIGSDVPFFVYGGTALVEGRGERVSALPDAPEAWVVLVAPTHSAWEKTATMYGALHDRCFSDGSRSAVLSQRVRRGEPVRKEDLHDVFERVAYEVFEGLKVYRDALLSAGAGGVHLAGAGPALFALMANEAEARGLVERVEAPEAKVFVTRTLGAHEATVVSE